jgi:hypothetical protein
MIFQPNYDIVHEFMNPLFDVITKETNGCAKKKIQ